jgi:SHS2 domain-containing protein
MRPYQVLPKTTKGEVAYEATGKDLNILFANAAKALESIVVNLSAVRCTTIRKINLEGGSTADLLYRFLSELVVLKDTYQLIFSDVEVKTNDNGTMLSGALRGESINKKRHRLKQSVKAVTKRHFKLEKTKEGWLAQVTLEL